MLITRSILILACLLAFISPATFADDKPEFDAEIAWSYLIKQCDFGVRNPGSDGARKCRDFLFKELKKYTTEVRLQPFTHYDARLKRTFYLNNIIADFGKGIPRVVLFAHWDTRPRAEYDPDPSRRTEPILGANDGASGVAVLLEIARLLSLMPAPIPIQIIFFDGEDYGRPGENWDYLLGSKFFVQTIDPSEYRYGVLLDLIGDSDLEIKREYNSYKYARELQDRIWNIARNLGAYQFTNRMQPPVTDDHLPFIEIGIPAVDLIDFDYKYWHTTADIPENCSVESLEAVGKVVVELIYSEIP